MYPDLIHVENKTFVRPNYTQLPLLFKMNFDWSKNYAIHLYIRFYKLRHNFHDNRKKGQPRDNYIVSLFNSNIITSTFVPVVKPHTHKLYISRHATNIAYL
jgi:hypothetical protein